MSRRLPRVRVRICELCGYAYPGASILTVEISSDRVQPRLVRVLIIFRASDTWPLDLHERARCMCRSDHSDPSRDCSRWMLHGRTRFSGPFGPSERATRSPPSDPHATAAHFNAVSKHLFSSLLSASRRILYERAGCVGPFGPSEGTERSQTLIFKGTTQIYWAGRTVRLSSSS